MPLELSTLVERYDEVLGTAEYAEVDASANGLQVGRRGTSVDRVAFAVDAALETIHRAADEGADVLVTHHGAVWDGLERVTGSTYDRVAALVESDLALYVSHLPLDGHQEHGNAAGVASVLGLEDREPFGMVGGLPVGQAGVLPEPADLDQVCEVLKTAVNPADGVRVFGFGPSRVERVAVVTGSGADLVPVAAAAGMDVLVTGEGKHGMYHEAKEAGVSVVLAGHYATETFGVRSLMDLAEAWGCETVFLDVPTGL